MTDDLSTDRPAESPTPATAASPVAAPPGPVSTEAVSTAATGRPAGGPASGRRTASGPIQYKGADLDPERGPGLGCFWIQVVVLAILIVMTPLSVSLGWPSEVSAILLFVTIGLLLLVGQTIIFLLRLVAADRRGRRRPLASSTRTVGEIEDATVPDGGSAADASGVGPPTVGIGEPAAPEDHAGSEGSAGSAERTAPDPGSEASGDVRQ